jgi:hypothetical protein
MFDTKVNNLSTQLDWEMNYPPKLPLIFRLNISASLGKYKYLNDLLRYAADLLGK